MKFLARLFGRKGTSELVKPEDVAPLTVEAIRASPSDDHLLKFLSAELGRVIPDDLDDYDLLAEHISRLPLGLRAMAAVHRLDVSLSLDSLKEHFSNFHSWAYAEQTLEGLHELGLTGYAQLFETALIAVRPHWDAKALDPFLEQQLMALTEQMWDLQQQEGPESLLDAWPAYARRHPERVVIAPSAP